MLLLYGSCCQKLAGECIPELYSERAAHLGIGHGDAAAQPGPASEAASVGRKERIVILHLAKEGRWDLTFDGGRRMQGNGSHTATRSGGISTMNGEFCHDAELFRGESNLLFVL